MTSPTAPDRSTAPADIPAAHRQAKYQVRFDWGVEGAAAVAHDADVVVWVDALRTSDSDSDSDGGRSDGDAAEVPAALLGVLPDHAALLLAGLIDADAVARWILAEQVRLGRRAMVALVAAGGTTAAGTLRVAVEDFLAVGAVVDGLAAVGIDYASPEAAAACAAFTGLRGAVAHLLTASASGQERAAAGVPLADIAVAGRLGSSDAVTVLRASRQPGASGSE